MDIEQVANILNSLNKMGGDGIKSSLLTVYEVHYKAHIFQDEEAPIGARSWLYFIDCIATKNRLYGDLDIEENWNALQVLITNLVKKSTKEVIEEIITSIMEVNDIEAQINWMENTGWSIIKG